jgi:hypothetical protein
MFMKRSPFQRRRKPATERKESDERVEERQRSPMYLKRSPWRRYRKPTVVDRVHCTENVDNAEHTQLSAPSFGRKRRPTFLREMANPKANSTSSMFSVRDTIQQPNESKILRSLARLLLQMISSDTSTYKKDPFACGSNSRIPTIEQVHLFLHNMYRIAEWSQECNIIALVLLSRLCHGDSPVRLTFRNWNRLTLIAFLIAQKMWDDGPLANTSFISLWHMAYPASAPSSFNVSKLNQLERIFLQHLQWETHVPRSIYCKFYFEMRALSMEVGSAEDFPLEPLTDDQAQHLEMRSQKEHVEGLLTNEERFACLSGPSTDKIGRRNPFQVFAPTRLGRSGIRVLS